ncbi:MAG: ABC transporter ATP-binding protein [Geminicoccaceae bacterium]|nr:ABC transporter ATP-binding protein [Geminicoccaceae bacterium]
MPLLEVEELGIVLDTRKGPLCAVDRASFAIDRGEILGLVGESGAGKSLIATAIIGLLAPPARIAGGTVRLAGRRIDDLDAEAMRRIRGRAIGAIFQDPLGALNPLFTIGRQLEETIRVHRALDRRAARARAVELLRAVGIPDPERRLDAYPHELSGGMRQRVVIALALCADPLLVVADEPTTALDVSVQAQILRLLEQSCRERGAAVLLVTHDLGAIGAIADRVAVLYAGRIVEIGPVAAVVRTPCHPYTRGLLGAIPRIGARPRRLVQIEGTMPRLDAVPTGCAFHPRCPHAVARCRGERPELEPVGEGHAVACFRPRGAEGGLG